MTANSPRMSDDTHIENAFFLPIDGEKGVDFLVEKGSDLARSQAQAGCGPGKILCYMPYVQVDIPVGPLFIFPFGPCEKGCPHKDRAGCIGHILVQSGLCDLETEIPFLELF